jgi:hypothetical protein
VTRAFNIGIEDFTFGKRSLGVAATVADGVHVLTDTEDGYPMVTYFEPEARLIRQVRQWRNLDPGHQTLPAS